MSRMVLVFDVKLIDDEGTIVGNKTTTSKPVPQKLPTNFTFDNHGKPTIFTIPWKQSDTVPEIALSEREINEMLDRSPRRWLEVSITAKLLDNDDQLLRELHCGPQKVPYGTQQLVGLTTHDELYHVVLPPDFPVRK